VAGGVVAMNPPVVGHALTFTWLVMLAVLVRTGVAPFALAVGVCVYPFFHLAVQGWHATRRKWGRK